MMIPAPVQRSSVVDALLVGIIAVVLSIVVGGGLVVEVAALLAGHAFPALSASVIAHGVINWHSFVSDPRLAFPPPLRGQLPGTRLMYTSVAICAAVTLVLATAVLWLILNRPSRAERDRRERRRQVLAASRRSRRRLKGARGLAVAVPVQGGRPVVVRPDRSIGVIMPAGSGKSSCAVGYILESPGAVLAASSKQDLLAATAVMREQSTRQHTLVFDPLGCSGWANYVRWSPIIGCQQPQVATRRAEAMIAGTLIDEGANGSFWKASGTLLLRRVLHACALAEAGVAELRAWLADPFHSDLNHVAGQSPAAQAWLHDLTMMTRQRGETVDSVAVMTSPALECFGVPQVVKTCSPGRGEAFDPAGWIATGGTLHILAGDEESTAVTPLIVAFVDEIVSAVTGPTAAQANGANTHNVPRPKLRLVLDDMPAVCPLPRLSRHLADGGPRGLQIMWYARGRAQLAERFGRERGASIISATSTMLYGGGLNDPELLQDVSTMLGVVVVRQRTAITDRLGFRSFGERYAPVAVLEPSEIYRLAPFEAVMLTGGADGAVVRLIPWWKRPDAELVRQGIAEAQQHYRSPSPA